MANQSNVASAPTGQSLPIPYLTAVWAGVPMDEILAGLTAGNILAPPGAPAGWRPAGAGPARGSTAATSALEADARAAIQSASQDVGALDRRIDDAAHRANVVDLRGKTGAELAELAATDIGYRYALEHMQPLARVGNRNLYATVNADGHLDRFDPDTGEALLSDAWLADRGKFMAWRSAEIAGAEPSLVSAQGWTFTDHGQVGVDGKPLVIDLQGTDATAVRHQVIFGNSTAETLRGGNGTDRIYGGAGDDMLRGGAGADRLEGGDGDDVVLGGVGNDQLLGNRGADELDGGGGRDTLAGGSGDDMLAGGGGDDHLEGGTGRDVYTFDAGDGRDTVADTDGLGEIVIDGIAVSGSMAQAGDAWTTADGRFGMDFDGGDGGTGTLTIRSTAADASAADAITIEAWTNGDLGISLDGLDDAASADATDAQDGNALAADVVTDATSQDATMSPAIHYGDTAPYQSTSSADVPADAATAATSSSTADEGTGASSDAPGGDGNGSHGGSAGSPAEAVDFDTALTSLLCSQDSAFEAIDPARVQQAIDAFSGVLEAPDVPQAAAEHTASDALTDADIADALAANSADYDADEVAGTDVAWRPPAWLQTDGNALQSDGRTAAPLSGSTAQR